MSGELEHHNRPEEEEQMQILRCPHCGTEGKILVCEKTRRWFPLLGITAEDNWYEAGDPIIKYEQVTDVDYMCDNCQKTVLLEDIVVIEDTVTCKFCHEQTPSDTAHLHDGGWVGDQCCWDERLRSTE